jgi:hypothetical protein
MGIKFGRKLTNRTVLIKIIGGVSVCIIVLLIPIIDEIGGKIYFNHICKNETGIKVYKTIELPDEYWDNDGKPNFYDYSNGNFTLPREKFYKSYSKKSDRLFGIEEDTSIRIDINTKEILSEDKLFRYWGGYIKRNFTPHNTANHCGQDSKEFVEKQFKHITNK